MACIIEEFIKSIDSLMSIDGITDKDKAILNSIGSYTTRFTSAIPADGNRKTTVPGKFINHSGGALGADTYWGDIGKAFGVTSNHYYKSNSDKSKPSEGNTEITDDEYSVGVRMAKRAHKLINDGKKFATNRYTLGLLARNWVQVANSDAIYAIAELDGEFVNGGTGYAVAMATIANKPIFVFSPKDNQWYKKNYDNVDTDKSVWEKLNTAPTLTQNFAGIGTRDISDYSQQIKNGDGSINYVPHGKYKEKEALNAINAIRDVYKATFGDRETAIAIKSNIAIEGKELTPLNLGTQDTTVRIGKGSVYSNPFASFTSDGKEKLKMNEDFINWLKKGIPEGYKIDEDTKSKLSLIRQKLDSGELDNTVFIQKQYGNVPTEASMLADYTNSRQSTQKEVVQNDITPIKVDSNQKGLNAVLTNPTALAKVKGNIQQDYPITFNNKVYKDVEAAYQANKDLTESKSKPSIDNSSNYKLMVNLISIKLAAYPNIADKVKAVGGIQYLNRIVHQPTNTNSVWETGGQDWFKKALIEAYTESSVNSNTANIGYNIVEKQTQDDISSLEC